ncbi:hypothetical protein, partial [Paenibacillus antibioticophila]|uniref:hypothetical protein n=1 Tax=Paenibacillus antibioticophila TaxID=1274374 RepID=UPI0013053C2E
MKHAGETYSQSRNDRRITVKIGAVNEYAQETGQMGGREQAASSQQEQGRIAAGNFSLRGKQTFEERRDYQQGQGGQWRPEPAQRGRGGTARVPVAARR